MIILMENFAKANFKKSIVFITVIDNQNMILSEFLEEKKTPQCVYHWSPELI